MDRRYPLVAERLPRFLHGGDYNPEQWPPEIWDEDIRLMKTANVNVATVGVFSWVSLQPASDRYEFGWLDTVMDKLAENGIYAVLATPSAAQPAWLSRAHPEVLRADANGTRRRHGRRVNYCPNSAVYRDASAAMARRLAERYGEHPALILWHVSNEYGGACYCEQCAEEFRAWLQSRYESLDELNRKWWTPFWSHTYTDWSQLEPPYSNGEQSIPALNVDWMRFSDESMRRCYLNERAVLREITPNVPITTNMMGFYYPIDYRKWAPETDVISWDCYPQTTNEPAAVAFGHDLNYGLQNRPFLLMEQTPSTQNYKPVNALKRPGQMRLWSYIAVAHGADSVMYFQWRRGRGGIEQLHGAVIEHAGHEHNRVFREVAALGSELSQLGDQVLGAGVDASVAVVFDWENWWVLENTSGPIKDKLYRETVYKHYAAFWDRNIPVAVIGTDANLDDYKVVIAPMLYSVRNEWGAKVADYVRRGGCLVTTCLSGWVDENALAHEGGYPGPLREVAGVWIEEMDALYPGDTNRIIMKQPFGPCRGEYDCMRLCDSLHTETASVLATYGEDFYARQPAVTENRLGEGACYYIGTDPEAEFLEHFYRTLCADREIVPVLESPANVEVRRRSQNDRSFLFVLNHNRDFSYVDLGNATYRDMLTGAELTGSIPLRGFDVRVMEEL